MSRRLRSRKRKRDMDENISSPSVPSSTRLLQAVSDRNIMEVSSILESTTACISQEALNTALFQAAEQGQKRILHLLVNHGACVNKSNSKGHTPLMAASEHGYLDIVEILFKSGAKVNRQNKAGKTALMLGVEKACSIALLNFFLSRKCHSDVNLQDKNGKTALMVATELCDFLAMEALIFHKGIKTDLKDKGNKTARDIAKENGIEEVFSTFVECTESKRFISCLMMAVKKRNIDLVKAFLDSEVSNVDLPDLDDQTPLILALRGISEGPRDVNLEIFYLLLQGGANVNKGERQSKWTPLMYATEAGSLEAVKALVASGAHLNIQTASGKLTALMISAQKGRLEITDFLIKSKAQINLKNAEDETALMLALKNHQKDCAKLLIDSGAESNDLVFMLAAQHGLYRLFPSNSEKLVSQNTINELLRYGIMENNCDLVSFLLDNGANVNEKGHLMCDPLILACKDVDLVRLLLEKGANVNARDGALGVFPLVTAVQADNYEVVKTLVEKGADTTIETERGETPLIIALEHQKRGALKALLDSGVDVNYNSTTSKIALHSSVKSCSDEVTELLLRHSADVNVQDRFDNTALMFSSELSECKRLMELLLKYGADVNMQSADGATALMMATRSKNYESVKILIGAGADVNKSDVHGRTPLMIASQICTIKIIDLLIKSGADVNATDRKDRCVLSYAAEYSILGTDKIGMLIDAGANVNPSNTIETPLMTAVKNCKSNIVSFLIERGAALNTQDPSGKTALMCAVDYNSNEHVNPPNFDTLIAKGADLDIQTHGGCTALMFASQRRHPGAVKALIDAGANVNIVERYSGENALSHLSLNLSNFHFNWTTLMDYGDGLECLELLLKGGSKVEISEHNVLFFHKLIIGNNQRLVKPFAQAFGVPYGFPVTALRGFKYFVMKGPYIHKDIISHCKSLSPLCTAILNESVEIAQFFMDNWFFTEQDVQLQNNPAIWQVFDSYRRRDDKLEPILDSVIFKPWSLASLSFVAVSKALGTNQEREKRVKALPLPSVMQEKLLFKNCVGSLSGPGREEDYLRDLGRLMYSDHMLGMDEQD